MSNLYKLLIVEDEDIVREGLIETIEWNTMGFQVIKALRNGQEAIDFIANSNIKVDVIMTDIKMPRMSGTELLKTIKDIFPQIQVVFLSGYDDFDYAREGIDNGLFAYILKLNIEEEIPQIFKKLFAHLEKKKEYNNPDALSSQLETTYLLDMLSTTRNDKITNFSSTVILWTRNTEDSKKASLVLQTLNLSFSYLVYGKYIVCFLNSNTVTNNFVCTLQSKMKMNQIHGFLVSIGKTYGQSPKSLNNSLYDAIKAMDLSIRESRSLPNIIYFKDIHDKLQDTMVDPDISITSQYLLSGDCDGLKEFITSLSDQCILSKYTNIKSMHKLGSELVLYLYNLAKSLYNIQDIDIIKVLNQLTHCLSVYDVEKSLHKYSDTIIELVQKSSDFGDINKAIIYINENYVNSDLSLESTASFINLSPNYLSTMFKKSMDITFSDYVKSKRLDLAVKLLKSSSLKLYQVAEKCGYNDVKHFSRTFKKEYGMSPSEYREN